MQQDNSIPMDPATKSSMNKFFVGGGLICLMVVVGVIAIKKMAVGDPVHGKPTVAATTTAK